MASQAKAGKAAKAKTGTRQKDNSKASKAHKDALAARIRASLLAGDPPLSDGEMDVVTDYILAAAHDRDAGEPVIEAGINFATAIPRFAASAPNRTILRLT